MVDNFTNDSIEILKSLIAIPSFSKEEQAASNLLEQQLWNIGLEPKRWKNNLWITAPNYDEQKPTILLNSHIDTVKPSNNWTTDPFLPLEKEGKLFGLGSNDAGGSLVALIATYKYLSQKKQNYNLIFAASAEEEISGNNGIAALLPKLGRIDLAIVGEPTLMQMAVAEKGLMVIDGMVKGKAGHAARNEGVNAIYEALPILQQLQNFEFEKESEFLGPVKLTVTGINAGTQHNVVPDQCTFMLDVRVNDCYSNQEVFDILQKKIKCHLKARSFRLNSSSISTEHPIVKKGHEMGLASYGSPTLSDQALMNFTTLKIGPGDSARSHTTDEYIYIHEIKKGVQIYIDLLDGLTI